MAAASPGPRRFTVSMMMVAIMLLGTLSSPASSQSLFEDVSEIRTDPEGYAEDHTECFQERYDYYGEPGAPSEVDEAVPPLGCTPSSKELELATLRCGSTDVPDNHSELADNCDALTRCSLIKDACSALCPELYCSSSSAPKTDRQLLGKATFEGRLYTNSRPIEGNVAPTTFGHDWDSDGLPDIVDEVNLPSEALRWSSPADKVILPLGMGEQDFLVLVEPSHRQAQFVLSEAAGTALNAVDPSSDASVSDILGGIEEMVGVRLRNSIARAVQNTTEVHLHFVAPGVPTTLTPTWNGSVPADGTWLVVRTDPARPVQMVLGGVPVEMAPPFSSHFTLEPSQEVRWEFVNAHDASTACIDHAAATPVAACSPRAEPGWLRAYSGHAARTLELLHTGLVTGAIPIWGGLMDPVAATAQNASTAISISAPVSFDQRLASEEFRVQYEDENSTTIVTPLGTYTVPVTFANNAESTRYANPFEPGFVSVLGNQSKLFQPGVGVNYYLQENSTSYAEPFVQQPLPQDAGGGIPRRFNFQSSLTSIPATPRDLNSLRLVMEPADPHEHGSWFTANLTQLRSLLDASSNESIDVDIDEAHQSGFKTETHNESGHEQLWFYVPHFSAVILEFKVAGGGASLTSADLVSPNEGWIAGASNVLYQYDGSSLTARNLPVSNSHRVIDVAAISATQAYAAVGQGMNSPFPDGGIWHYNGGTWAETTTSSLGFSGGGFQHIWMSSTGSTGYAAGIDKWGYPIWAVYGGGTWSSATNPSLCTVSAMDLDGSGNGWISAFGTTPAASCWDGSEGNDGIFAFSGGSSTQIAGSDVLPTAYGLSQAEKWAATGDPGGGLPGIYQWDGSNWNGFADPAAGSTFYDVDTVNSGSDAWFLGRGRGADINSPLLAHYAGGTFASTHYPASAPLLYDIEFATDYEGIMVGENAVWTIRFNQPPVVSDSLSPTGGTTVTEFRATTTSAYDPDDPAANLLHQWNWDDGTVTTGEDSEHSYSSTGMYTVEHRVTDEDGDRTTNTYSVEVKPSLLPRSTSSCTVNQFASPSGPDAHAYQVQDASEERAVTIEFCGTTDSNLIIHARLGSPVTGIGEWPSMGNEGTQLTGVIPAGATLHLSVVQPEATTGDDYGIRAFNVAKPNNPTVSGTVAEVGAPVTLAAKATHPDGFYTQFWVDWKDGSPPEAHPSGGFESPSETRIATHSFPGPDTHLIDVWSVDEFGIPSPTTTKTIKVLNPPAGTALSPTAIDSTKATLRGRIDDLGGDTSGNAWFDVYLGGTYQHRKAHPSSLSEGATFEIHDTSLQGGRTYEARLTVRNSLAAADAGTATFSTPADLDVTPDVTIPTATALKDYAVIDINSEPSISENYYYVIYWGDGTSLDFPLSGYMPAPPGARIQHKYAFPGTYDIEVRIENEYGQRSHPAQGTVAVAGVDPLKGYSSDPVKDGAVVTVEVDDLALPEITGIAVHVYDPTTNSWRPQESVASPIDSDSVHEVTISGLTPGIRYPVEIHFTADGRNSWESGPLGFEVTANSPPKLVPEPMLQAEYSYAQEVRWTVEYKDVDGDIPTGSGVQISFDGGPWEDMVREMDLSLVTSGIRYAAHDELLEGGGPVVRFRANDGFHSVEFRGADAFVYQPSIWVRDFETDPLLGTPVGFVPRDLAGRAPSHWHVTDTSASAFPDRLSAGMSGNAVWFGIPAQGDYADSRGRPVGGILETPPINLRRVAEPTLSFRSYFETESVGGSKDIMTVTICIKATCGDGDWTEVYRLDEEADGYKRWSTVSVPLGAYRDADARIRFGFDSVTKWDNNFLGWFIDDVALGSDLEQDGLADIAEALTGATLRTYRPLGIATGAGEYAITQADIPSVHFVDRIVVAGTIKTDDPEGIDVGIIADPAWDQHTYGYDPAKSLVSFSGSDSGTAKICGEDVPITTSLAPYFAGGPLNSNPFTAFNRLPAGLLPEPEVGLALRTTSDGLQFQAIVTGCLDYSPSSSLPPDPQIQIGPATQVWIVMDNAGPSDAVLEALDLHSRLTWSGLSDDTDANGISDLVQSRGSGVPTGLDIDADNVPLHEDGDWTGFDAVPALILDFERQRPHREYQLIFDGDAGITALDASVGGRSLRVTPSSEGAVEIFTIHWEGFAAEAPTIVIDARDKHGGRLDIRVDREPVDGWMYASDVEFTYSKDGAIWVQPWNIDLQVKRNELLIFGSEAIVEWGIARGTGTLVKHLVIKQGMKMGAASIIGHVSGFAAKAFHDYAAGEFYENLGTTVTLRKIHPDSTYRFSPKAWSPGDGSHYDGLKILGPAAGKSPAQIDAMFQATSGSAGIHRGISFREYWDEPSTGLRWVFEINANAYLTDLYVADYATTSDIFEMSPTTASSLWSESLVSSRGQDGGWTDVDQVTWSSCHLHCKNSANLAVLRQDTTDSLYLPRDAVQGLRNANNGWGPSSFVSANTQSTDALALLLFGQVYQEWAAGTPSGNAPVVVTYWGELTVDPFCASPSVRRCYDPGIGDSKTAGMNGVSIEWHRPSDHATMITDVLGGKGAYNHYTGAKMLKYESRLDGLRRGLDFRDLTGSASSVDVEIHVAIDATGALFDDKPVGCSSCSRLTRESNTPIRLGIDYV